MKILKKEINFNPKFEEKPTRPSQPPSKPVQPQPKTPQPPSKPAQPQPPPSTPRPLGIPERHSKDDPPGL